jgi:serine/threonine protein kinase
MAEVVDILEYLHSNNIAHRDLKPDNFLLDENYHIKFSDFGAAKVCSQTKGNEQGNGCEGIGVVKEKRKPIVRRGTLVGTQNYVAPEILLTQESDMRADLWSLGCILYELFAGKPPFNSLDEEITYQKILWGEFTFPPQFPEFAKDLCKKLIRLEKDRRLGSGVDGFKKLKEHEFFYGMDFDDLNRDAEMNELIEKETEGMNYAVTSSFNIDFCYYSPSNKLFHEVKCNNSTLKQGCVKKECGWISYKKVKLVLTNEPKLLYYSLHNVCMVTIVNNIGRD